MAQETISLQELLNQHTKEGILYEKLPDHKVRCYSCGHRCTIGEGKFGVCRVRFNREGTLFVPTGYVGALQLDPIEKKPFFHAYPGSQALSFGMLGCDFHCPYCQNWITSQTLRDPTAGVPPTYISPNQFAALAERYGARVVTSTYNEPLITSEWAVEIFKVAKARGLVTSYVSNGNGTREVLEFIRPWVDLYKVDLKSFDERQYHVLGGNLSVILETIRMLKEMDFWVEIVTLIVPGFNDTSEELTRIADFLVSVSPDIPWHVTAFHSDYKMMDTENTDARKIIEAAEIGYGRGLHFVYAGNLPGEVNDYENTYCPHCRTVLIERYGYEILGYHLVGNQCPKCHREIPGRWEEPPTTED